MAKKPILCLDFDGVIHLYSSGWKGARNIPDMPVSGALEFIVTALKDFDVRVYSSRSNQFGGRKAMRKWLYDRYAEIGGVKRTGYPSPFRQFDVNLEVPKIPKWYWMGVLNDPGMDPWEYEVDYGVRQLLKKVRFPKVKPPATISIDDRCLTFTGKWPDMKELQGFKPWNKQSL